MTDFVKFNLQPMFVHVWSLCFLIFKPLPSNVYISCSIANAELRLPFCFLCSCKTEKSHALGGGNGKGSVGVGLRFWLRVPFLTFVWLIDV